MTSNGRGLLVCLIFVSVVWFAITYGSQAQSRHDLTRKYPSRTALTIKHGVVAFVEFDARGEVCRYTIQKDPSTAINAGEGFTFKESEVDPLIDALAPSSLRGAEEEYFDPSSWVAGGAFAEQRNYEHVSVRTVGTYPTDSTGGVETIQMMFRGRKCEAATRDAP